MEITKELLEEKYNIREAAEEMFYMDGIRPTMFAMWPAGSGGWVIDYQNPDIPLFAHAIIKTEDELITTLKFSKLI